MLVTWQARYMICGFRNSGLGWSMDDPDAKDGIGVMKFFRVSPVSKAQSESLAEKGTACL